MTDSTFLRRVARWLMGDVTFEGNVTINGVLDGLGLEWSTWAPTYAASGSMTYTSVTTQYARYLQLGKITFFCLESRGTTGGTASNTLYFTTPTTMADAAQDALVTGWVKDSSSVACWGFANSTTQIGVRRYASGNFGLGTDRRISVFGFYETA